jgi:hypothetical protein
VVGQQDFNYTNHTFTGLVLVQRVPFEMTSLTIDKVIKELDFESIGHVKDVKDKLSNILVEQKQVTGTAALDALPNEANFSAKPQTQKVNNKESIENGKSIEKPNSSTTQEKSQKGAEKPKPTAKQVIKDLSLLPKVFKEQLKNKGKITKVTFKKDSEPTNHESTEPQVKSDKLSWPGTKRVETIAYFKGGYCLSHIFKNRDNEEEAVIYCSPKNTPYDSLPLVTATEGQAKYLLLALTQHPKMKLSLTGFNIMRLKEFNLTSVNASAYVVSDPKTYINATAKAMDW